MEQKEQMFSKNLSRTCVRRYAMNFTFLSIPSVYLFRYYCLMLNFQLSIINVYHQELSEV